MVALPGLRNTSRIVLMDPTGAVLLFKTLAPDSSGFSRWITPGGGLDPGETHSEAALRELFEETGRRFTDAGEPVWVYDFEVKWDRADHDRGHAEYFLVHTERFEPTSEFWTPEEHHDVSAWGWFSAEEIGRAATPFEPEFLPDLVSRLCS